VLNSRFWTLINRSLLFGASMLKQAIHCSIVKSLTCDLEGSAPLVIFYGRVRSMSKQCLNDLRIAVLGSLKQ